MIGQKLRQCVVDTAIFLEGPKCIIYNSDFQNEYKPFLKKLRGTVCSSLDPVQSAET